MADNLLLAALPRADRERLRPALELVDLEIPQTLIEPNKPITDIYFPIDCVTSTIQELSDGSSIEVGMMGIEGVVGIQLWLHATTTPTRTLIQVSGRAHRMSAADFKREVLEISSPLNDLIARYTHGFLVMTSQTAACNRLHTIDERLCRWLKMTHNRVRRDHFDMRQEFLAQMLGVHRPSVSVAANMLQQAGLIRYSRGRMEILNPQGLQEGSCECLGIIEEQIDRIFDRSWRELADE